MSAALRSSGWARDLLWRQPDRRTPPPHCKVPHTSPLGLMYRRAQPAHQLPDCTKKPTCISLSQFISLLSKPAYRHATLPSNFQLKITLPLPYPTQFQSCIFKFLAYNRTIRKNTSAVTNSMYLSLLDTLFL